MEKVIKKLNELIDKKASDEEYKEFLGSLSEDEWEFLVRELPKNPFLGKLSKLRKEYFKEHQ